MFDRWNVTQLSFYALLPPATLSRLPRSAILSLPSSTLSALPPFAHDSLPVGIVDKLPPSTTQRLPQPTVDCLRRAYDMFLLDLSEGELQLARSQLRHAEEADVYR